MDAPVEELGAPAEPSLGTPGRLTWGVPYIPVGPGKQQSK